MQIQILCAIKFHALAMFIRFDDSKTLLPPDEMISLAAVDVVFFPLFPTNTTINDRFCNTAIIAAAVVVAVVVVVFGLTFVDRSACATVCFLLLQPLFLFAIFVFALLLLQFLVVYFPRMQISFNVKDIFCCCCFFNDVTRLYCSTHSFVIANAALLGSLNFV